MNSRINEAYDAAVNYLANRMKTRSETEDHLTKKGFCREEIKTVLESLVDLGYLNDAQYVSIYLSHGIHKGKTLWRIKKELEQKGVEMPDIETGVNLYADENQESPEENEFDRGFAIAKKIIDNAGSTDKKMLAKAGRKLVSLGYSSETVYKILGQFIKNTDV